MHYISTRGAWAHSPQPFCAILLEGLAPDGGLAVPEAYPALSAGELARLRPLSYRELAFAVLRRFIDDIPAPDLKTLIERTYTAAAFGADEITPVTALEPGVHLLHASNGPTLAFKDIALQLLGNLFEYVLAERGSALNILGATSGDTGSSAEYAMRGKRGIAVFMLSPKGRMSPFQTAQMFSLADPDIHNVAIDGVFDDCQDIVKSLGADATFKARYALGTVNSINWARDRGAGRLLFQGLFRGRTHRWRAGGLRRAVGQLRQHPRGARREADGAADPAADPRHQRERRARRVLPHGQLPAARHCGDARDVESVDGHLQGIELRALRV